MAEAAVMDSQETTQENATLRFLENASMDKRRVEACHLRSHLIRVHFKTLQTIA